MEYTQINSLEKLVLSGEKIMDLSQQCSEEFAQLEKLYLQLAKHSKDEMKMGSAIKELAAEAEDIKDMLCAYSQLLCDITEKYKEAERKTEDLVLGLAAPSL